MFKTCDHDALFCAKCYPPRLACCEDIDGRAMGFVDYWPWDICSAASPDNCALDLSALRELFKPSGPLRPDLSDVPAWKPDGPTAWSSHVYTGRLMSSTPNVQYPDLAQDRAAARARGDGGMLMGDGLLLPVEIDDLHARILAGARSNSGRSLERRLMLQECERVMGDVYAQLAPFAQAGLAPWTMDAAQIDAVRKLGEVHARLGAFLADGTEPALTPDQARAVEALGSAKEPEVSFEAGGAAAAAMRFSRTLEREIMLHVLGRVVIVLERDEASARAEARRLPSTKRRQIIRALLNEPEVCPDCGGVVQGDYMVTDALWAQHGVGKGLLHLACLGRRMQRAVTLDDFPDKPVNSTIRAALAPIGDGRKV